MATVNHSTMQDGDKFPDLDMSEGVDNIKMGKSRKNVILSRIKRRILKHVFLLRGLIIALIIGVFAVASFFAFRELGKTGAGQYLSLARNFIFTPPDKIDTIDGRTNILILGKGGQGHEAPDLTDTIMIVSVDHEKSSFKQVSLPRDIWVHDLKTKLNSVYYWGNKKEQGGGIILAKASVEEIIGQPVQYALVLDFSGFKRIIDVLGGIEVDVANSFIDNKYPIQGKENDNCGDDNEFKCRYETLEFEKGVQKMDGERTLKFVRSRNSEGDEGTDLARSARQQKVISAIKEKTLSKEILLSPTKIFALKDAVLASIETDMSPEAAAISVRRLLQADFDADAHVISEELLENPALSSRYNNLYVFIPKEIDASDPSGRSWSKVQEFVKCILEDQNCH